MTDSEGSNITRQSGPNTMYLMQIENKYHEEDRQLKKDKIAARLRKEAAIGVNEESGHGTNSALKVGESDNPYA